MRNIRELLVLSVLGAAFLGACGGPALPPPEYYVAQERRGVSDYRIGPGDVLRVNVWQNEQLTTRVTVRPDGRITLPLIGDMRVAGKTPEEVNADVARAYSRYIQGENQVTVIVEEIHSYHVFVSGRVNRPGEFAPDRPVTVLQALTLAGGPTRFADEERIIILRGSGERQERIPFSSPAVVDDGRVEMNLTLRSGDTVMVP